MIFDFHTLRFVKIFAGEFGVMEEFLKEFLFEFENIMKKKDNKMNKLISYEKLCSEMTKRMKEAGITKEDIIESLKEEEAW